MKKLISLFSFPFLLTAVLPLDVSAKVDAIKPYAVVCSNCGYGVLLETTEYGEWDEVYSPYSECKCDRPDAYALRHYTEYRYNRLVTYCNNCGYRHKIIQQYEERFTHVPR